MLVLVWFTSRHGRKNSYSKKTTVIRVNFSTKLGSENQEVRFMFIISLN